MGSVTHSAKNLKTRERRNYQKCAIFFLWVGKGAGLMLALIFFFMLSVNGMSEDAAVGSGTLTRPVPRLSLIH